MNGGNYAYQHHNPPTWLDVITACFVNKVVITIIISVIIKVLETFYKKNCCQISRYDARKVWESFMIWVGVVVMLSVYYNLV